MIFLRKITFFFKLRALLLFQQRKLHSGNPFTLFILKYSFARLVRLLFKLLSVMSTTSHGFYDCIIVCFAPPGGGKRYIRERRSYARVQSWGSSPCMFTPCRASLKHRYNQCLSVYWCYREHETSHITSTKVSQSETSIKSTTNSLRIKTPSTSWTRHHHQIQPSSFVTANSVVILRIIWRNHNPKDFVPNYAGKTPLWKSHSRTADPRFWCSATPDNNWSLAESLQDNSWSLSFENNTAQK